MDIVDLGASLSAEGLDVPPPGLDEGAADESRRVVFVQIEVSQRRARISLMRAPVRARRRCRQAPEVSQELDLVLPRRSGVTIAIGLTTIAPWRAAKIE